MSEGMVRIKNVDTRGWEVMWNSMPHILAPGEAQVWPAHIAEHFKKRVPAAKLEFKAVTASYTEPAPTAAHRCPTCEAPFTDFGAFAAHVAPCAAAFYAAKQPAAPAPPATSTQVVADGDGAAEGGEPVWVTIDGDKRPALKIDGARGRSGPKVRLEDGTEVRVPAECVTERV
jgi:hypothetical protein